MLALVRAMSSLVRTVLLVTSEAIPRSFLPLEHPSLVAGMRSASNQLNHQRGRLMGRSNGTKSESAPER